MLIITVKTSGAVPKIAKRKLNNLYKASFRHVGVFWHRRFEKKHFTKRGAREYKYSPRQGELLDKGSREYRQSYTGRKEKLFGHTLPLVWSGASRTLAGIRDVRATSKGARVVIHARALNFKRKGTKKTMREEMTTISDREEKAILAEFSRNLTARFDRIAAKTSKRL